MSYHLPSIMPPNPLGELQTRLAELRADLAALAGSPHPLSLIEVQRAAAAARDRLTEILAGWPQTVARVYGSGDPGWPERPVPDAAATARRLARLQAAIDDGDRAESTAAFAALTRDEQQRVLADGLRRAAEGGFS